MDDRTHYEEAVEVGEAVCLCFTIWFSVDLLWWLR